MEEIIKRLDKLENAIRALESKAIINEMNTIIRNHNTQRTKTLLKKNNSKNSKTKKTYMNHISSLSPTEGHEYYKKHLKIWGNMVKEGPIKPKLTAANLEGRRIKMIDDTEYLILKDKSAFKLNPDATKWIWQGIYDSNLNGINRRFEAPGGFRSQLILPLPSNGK